MLRKLPVGLFLFPQTLLWVFGSQDLVLRCWPLQVCLEMTKKLHERCIQNHGEDSTVAKSIGASFEYAIAHKDIVQKYGRFPHR